MKIQVLAKHIERVAVDNSPAILTAVGVTGTVTTAIFASRASFKAADIIREMESAEGASEDPKERLVERTKATWQLYIPAVGIGTATIACIVFANQIGTRRAAAMAAAYSMSEKAFSEYREKIVEKVGEAKEQEARDEIAQERVERNPLGSQVIVMNEREVLCFDQYTGRYFNSDMETLKQAQNKINYRMIRENYASLNDFYDCVGLEWVPTGDDIGWNSDAMLELSFTTVLSDDQRPCIAIDFHTVPVRNFYRNN